MGESDRYIEYKNKYQPGRISFNINSPVVMLIIINFTVFLFVKFLTFGKVTGDTSIVPFFYEKLNAFLVNPTFKQLLFQPWSAISYSFFHFDFLTLLSNMIWLWSFGSILQSLAGNRHSIPVYLYGAFAGTLLFIATLSLSRNTLNPQPYFLYGANAAVMAVAVATTVLSPGFRIFRQLGGGMPIWILTLVYILVDLGGMGSVAAPYYAAHLAGALIGGLYIISYRRGYNWGSWMNNFYRWLTNLFNPEKSTGSKRVPVKEKVFYNTGNRSPYQKTANLTQQRIDEILDKINQKGYKYLTDEEKNILKRASEEGL